MNAGSVPAARDALAAAGAVIFDFDGVLVDSEPMHMRAIREVAAARGWAFGDEVFARMIGKGDEHAFELLAELHREPVTPAQIARLCEDKSRACTRLIQGGLFTVQPGVREVMMDARREGTRPTAICSGSRREVVVGMAERAGLSPLVRTIVTHEDVAHPKPDPEGYLLAAARLGVKPGDAVVIEDSPTGVRAGKAAGMRVIGVCHSFSADRLLEADWVLPRLADLA